MTNYDDRKQNNYNSRHYAFCANVLKLREASSKSGLFSFRIWLSYLHIGNFLQISIYDPNEIFKVKKKSLHKIEYWQRNGDFTFWPEVKVTRLIDILGDFRFDYDYEI